MFERTRRAKGRVRIHLLAPVGSGGAVLQSFEVVLDLLSGSARSVGLRWG
jgi:hypothetical protein